MRNTFITAGVFTAAMALNSGAAFGADALNRARTDAGQEGNQAIVGKLVSLCDYLGKDGQGTTSTSTSKSTTNSASSSQTPARSDSKELGSQAGKSGGFGGPGSEPSRSAARDQKDPQGSKVADRHGTSLSATGTDSSTEQTLVLIAQQGAARSGQPTHLGLTSPTPSQAAQGQFGSEQGSLSGSSAMASGGQAYVLVFGDDASSQSAYLKAKGMITEGSSNWATSSGDADDRIPVRGQDDVRPGGTRNVTGSLQAEETTLTGRTGQRDPAGKLSNTGSQVRVTGVLVSRGGIQAIRVSEISLASMQSDPAGKSTGSLDRDRTNANSDKTPEYNDKKRE